MSLLLKLKKSERLLLMRPTGNQSNESRSNNMTYRIEEELKRNLAQ